jgi:hypothetical protein
MKRSKPLWDFTEFVPNDRREKMLALMSFDEVIDQLIAGSIECCRFEPHKNYEYCRAFFKVRVGKTAYDAFFNSPVGYRAQYCLGIENGLKQNRRLIEALTALCLRAIKETEDTAYLEKKLLRSLLGIDAKVWINDEDWPVLDEIHINYMPWVSKAKNAREGTMAERRARTSAEIGVLAPENTHIEIKGGWLTSDNHEWRDPDKAQRAQEIHDYGAV